MMGRSKKLTNSIFTCFLFLGVSLFSHFHIDDFAFDVTNLPELHNCSAHSQCSGNYCVVCLISKNFRVNNNLSKGIDFFVVLNFGESYNSDDLLISNKFYNHDSSRAPPSNLFS